MLLPDHGFPGMPVASGMFWNIPQTPGKWRGVCVQAENAIDVLSSFKDYRLMGVFSDWNRVNMPR